MADDDIDRSIGAIIQRLRESAGISQAGLAKQLSADGLRWTQGTLSRVENGERPIKLSEAAVLARRLRVSVSGLLPGEDMTSFSIASFSDLEIARESLRRMAESPTSRELFDRPLNEMFNGGYEEGGVKR